MSENFFDNKLSRRWAFISGATSGIGQATAKLLAKNQVSLILNGRRRDRLELLQKALSQETKVHIAAFDVSSRVECERALIQHEKQFAEVSVLVNNAGLAHGADPLHKAAVDDWEKMIDTNVKGVLYLTRMFLPFLEKNASSHIVNIGSVAGRGVYPGGAVYCATKYAIAALTEGLRMDLQGKKIRVTNIAPGMVETEFSQVRFKDADKASAVYRGMTPLSGNDIAESIVWCLSRPANVNIQEMTIYPTDQASLYHVYRREEN